MKFPTDIAVTPSATSLGHRFVVNALGGMLVVVAFVGGVFVSVNITHHDAGATTPTVSTPSQSAPVSIGLCVVGCDPARGQGSVGAPTIR